MTAALRAWGIGRVVLMVGAAMLLIETTATNQFGLPTIEDRINGWSLLPALVALVMTEPLVDRSPELTAHATRPFVVIAVGRLALAYAGAGAVAGYCQLSRDGHVVAVYVVAGLSLAAVAVALAGRWYWVPLVPVSFAWLQHAAGDFPRPGFAVPLPVLLAVVASSCLAYVAGSALREEVQRRQ